MKWSSHHILETPDTPRTPWYSVVFAILFLALVTTIHTSLRALVLIAVQNFAPHRTWPRNSDQFLLFVIPAFAPFNMLEIEKPLSPLSIPKPSVLLFQGATPWLKVKLGVVLQL